MLLCPPLDFTPLLLPTLTIFDLWRQPGKVAEFLATLVSLNHFFQSLCCFCHLPQAASLSLLASAKSTLRMVLGDPKTAGDDDDDNDHYWRAGVDTIDALRVEAGFQSFGCLRDQAAMLQRKDRSDLTRRPTQGLPRQIQRLSGDLREALMTVR
jgi:hypothetical protein